MFVRKGLLSDEVMSIMGEYVQAVMSMVLSWLKDKYRGSALNVRMGAELPDMEDAARIDFLSEGVTNPIISLIFTEPAILGVGSEGNSIINWVFAAKSEGIVI